MTAGRDIDVYGYARDGHWIEIWRLFLLRVYRWFGARIWVRWQSCIRPSIDSIHNVFTRSCHVWFYIYIYIYIFHITTLCVFDIVLSDYLNNCLCIPRPLLPFGSIQHSLNPIDFRWILHINTQFELGPCMHHYTNFLAKNYRCHYVTHTQRDCPLQMRSGMILALKINTLWLFNLLLRSTFLPNLERRPSHNTQCF